MKKIILMRALLFLTILNQSINAQIKNIKGLVILIDYSDAPASATDMTPSRASDIFNKVGYTETTLTASVRDYWFLQSRGKINLTNHVSNYFRAPQTAKWYQDRNNWVDHVELARQAIQWFVANNPNFDWNSLTVSQRPGEENTFASLNFITTKGIPGSGGSHGMPYFIAPNGVKSGIITAQTFSQDADVALNMFTFIHELGHSIFGEPDTYDPDGSSAGTGHYSVMSGNQANGQIESFGGPFLMRRGFVNAIDMIPNQSYILKQDGNSVARFVNPNDPKEYFLIEARMKSTLGNEMIPTERGLLIWHVDNNVTTGGRLEDMTPAAHYEYSIEQADGRFDLEKGVNQRDGGDYYVQGNVFSNTSTPNTKWWNETSSNLNINSIKFLPNNEISFCNGNCDNNLSIEDNVYNSKISIYPNPAENILNISNLQISSKASATIVNVQGRVLLQTVIKNNTVDISQLSSGIYLITINNEDKVAHIKFVKK